MSILFFIKIVAWIFVLGPMSIFLFISLMTLKGLTDDDPIIMAFTLVALALLLIGIILIALIYLTNFMPALLG